MIGIIVVGGLAALAALLCLGTFVEKDELYREMRDDQAVAYARKLRGD